MQDYKKLKVWQKAHQFALQIYLLSKQFPADERYGITSQMRRASLSIPTNIVEGCGREGQNELNRFLSIAMGSANEMEYLLLFANDISYIENSKYLLLQKDIIEIKKMLSSLQIKVKNSKL